MSNSNDRVDKVVDDDAINEEVIVTNLTGKDIAGADTQNSDGAGDVVNDGDGAGDDAQNSGDAGDAVDDGDGAGNAVDDSGVSTDSGDSNSDSSKSYESLLSELELEREKSSQYEQKLKLVLADFQNLSKKTQSTIENSVTARLGELMLDLLAIYDDFVRARDAFEKGDTNTDGLNSILRNMDAMLQKHAVTPIDALGEIFDPNMHEAISTDVDPSLDENTITKELRRGYMIKNTIIRPTLVVISKKE